MKSIWDRQGKVKGSCKVALGLQMWWVVVALLIWGLRWALGNLVILVTISPIRTKLYPSTFEVISL